MSKARESLQLSCEPGRLRPNSSARTGEMCSSRMIGPSVGFYMDHFSFFWARSFQPNCYGPWTAPASPSSSLPGGGEARAGDENFPELSLIVY
jgi:hypothetical protein